MADKNSINIQIEGGNIRDISGLIAGDVSGVVNLGKVEGSIINTPGKITNSLETENPLDIESLLSQLKVAIESESALAQDDEVEALEQVEILTAASQHPEDESHQKYARRAIKILKGTVVGLSNTTSLAKSCSELLPAIAMAISNSSSNQSNVQPKTHPTNSSGRNSNGTLQKTVILFLASDPTDASRLRLGTEIREIQENLQLARLRDEFRLEQRMSVRPKDISQAILDINPKIVHFSGHGTGKNGLCFENEVGKVQLVQSDALAALFDLVSEQVDCVLLNACYSEVQAKVIAKHINHVIGMNKALTDEAAVSFSVGFYQALGAGRTVIEAYKFGCVQVRLQGIPEHLTPILIG